MVLKEFLLIFEHVLQYYRFIFVNFLLVWTWLILRKKCPYSELFWSASPNAGRKMRTRITPSTDTFHAMSLFSRKWFNLVDLTVDLIFFSISVSVSKKMQQCRTCCFFYFHGKHITVMMKLWHFWRTGHRNNNTKFCLTQVRDYKETSINQKCTLFSFKWCDFYSIKYIQWNRAYNEFQCMKDKYNLLKPIVIPFKPCFFFFFCLSGNYQIL